MIWKKFLLLILSLFFINTVFCATEDYTTYTEVDEDFDLGVTSGTISVVTMRKDAHSWVYKAHTLTGDIDHDVDVDTDTFSSGRMCIHAMSDQNGGDMVDHDGANDGYGTYLNETGGAVWLRQIEWEGGSNTISGGGSGYNFGENQLKYVTVQRTGSTIYCKVYSDASRTTLISNLSQACSTEEYSYIFALTSYGSNSTDGSTSDGYVANLNLNEAAPAGAPQIIIISQ